MNEIKMTVKEAIEQLNDLKRDREGFAKNDEPDSVFAYDIKAIDVAPIYRPYTETDARLWSQCCLDQ